MKRLWIVGVLAGVTAFGTVSSISRPAFAATAKTQELRSEINKIDDEIQSERDKFYDRKDKLKDGSPEERKLVEEHTKIIRDLQARRAGLVKDLVGSAGPLNNASLKEELTGIDERIKEENTLHDKRMAEFKGHPSTVTAEDNRHTARLKALEEHRARLTSAMADVQGAQKGDRATLQTKLTEVDGQIQTEEARHNDAVKQFNDAKHRIGNQLNNKGLPAAQAAELRGEMGVQDNALRDENSSYQSAIELLQMRRTHIESLLAGAK